MADLQEAASRDLVYGVVTLAPDYRQPNFAPRERAEDLATIFAALNTATTWGEFKVRIPGDAFAEAVALATEDGEDEISEPASDEPFDQDLIHGGDPSDWPGWVTREMLEWMPKDIQRTFGKVEFTAISGDLLELNPDRIDEIVVALTQHGYHCTEDTALMERALGVASDWRK